jgi:bifunctional enzyme CysN/CysC
MRRSLSRDLGYSIDDRSENLRRSAEVARLDERGGHPVHLRVRGAARAVRQRVRQLLGEDRCLEVYLRPPPRSAASATAPACTRRAERGELKAFPGVSAPYEPPEQADLVLATDSLDVAGCVEQVLALLEQRGVLSAG